jgi:hypothetical protein
MAINSMKVIIIGEEEPMIGSITTQRVDPYLKKLIEKALLWQSKILINLNIHF